LEILSTFRRNRNGISNRFRLFFIATLLALAFAYMSWHLIEKRFLYFKKKHTSPVIPMSPFSIILGTGDK